MSPCGGCRNGGSERGREWPRDTLGGRWGGWGGLEPERSRANALRKGTPRSQTPSEGRDRDIPRVPTKPPKPHPDMGHTRMTPQFFQTLKKLYRAEFKGFTFFLEEVIHASDKKNHQAV